MSINFRFNRDIIFLILCSSAIFYYKDSFLTIKNEMTLKNLQNFPKQFNQFGYNIIYKFKYIFGLKSSKSIEKLISKKSLEIRNNLHKPINFLNKKDTKIGHLFQSWDNFYPDETYSGLFENTKYTGKTAFIYFQEDKNLYVYNCMFYDIKLIETDQISVVSCFNKISVLIESCLFDTIDGSNRGFGALDFEVKNCVLSKICGNNNITNSEFPFSYIRIERFIHGINYYQDVSVSHCFSAGTTMMIYYGITVIKSTNVSYNSCERMSAFDSTGSDLHPDTKIPISFSYSSITHNNSTQGELLSITADYAADELGYMGNLASYCNIIYNRKLTNDGYTGLIQALDNITFNVCCIMENEADFLFEFGWDYFDIFFLNCSIDNLTSIQFDPITEYIGTKSFINGLKFIETGNCVSIVDAVGSIPVVDVLPTTLPQQTSPPMQTTQASLPMQTTTQTSPPQQTTAQTTKVKAPTDSLNYNKYFIKQQAIDRVGRF